MTNPEETLLQDAFASAYPADEPSEALRRRVQTLAAQSKPILPRRQTHLAFAFASTFIFAALLAFWWPSFVMARTLARIQVALRDVTNQHTIVWVLMPDGHRYKSRETWHENGHWRIESSNADHVQSVEIVNDKQHWVYDTDENTVTADHRQMPNGYELAPALTLTDTLKQAVVFGQQWHTRIVGQTVEDGRTLNQIEIQDQYQPSQREEYYIDAETDLPVRTEHQFEKDNTWQIAWGADIYYNDSLSASLFQPEFPETARIVDKEAGTAAWQARLAPGIAAQNGVVVRDIQTNKNGDVFVLFTAPTRIPAEEVVSLTLTDNLGTHYVRINQSDLGGGCANFNATRAYQTDKGEWLFDGMAFGGQKLQMEWWVPIVPQNPWTPREFTLQIWPPVWVQTVPTFTLPVSAPECEVLPDYAPYLVQSLPELWVGWDAALLRAHYYQKHANNPAAAIYWYKEALAASRVFDKQQTAHADESDEWYALYELYTQIGHEAEAEDALRHASKDAVADSPLREKIRAAMQKLSP